MIACSSRTGARCPVVAVCAVLGLSAAFAGSAVAGLTVRKKPNIRLQGTYSNDHATIHFRSLRTRARVAAVVTDADGRVLLAVRGNRRDVPQVTFAGIVVTDHGDFSPEEQATLHALRTSPEALALGEMLRAQPAREPDTRDPWAALVQIAEEARTDPALVRDAPHKTRVARLDETRAARRPVLR